MEGEGGRESGDLHISESWKHVEVREALCGVNSELLGFRPLPLTPGPWQV